MSAPTGIAATGTVPPAAPSAARAGREAQHSPADGFASLLAAASPDRGSTAAEDATVPEVAHTARSDHRAPDHRAQDHRAQDHRAQVDNPSTPQPPALPAAPMPAVAPTPTPTPTLLEPASPTPVPPGPAGPPRIDRPIDRPAAHPVEHNPHQPLRQRSDTAAIGAAAPLAAPPVPTTMHVDPPADLPATSRAADPQPALTAAVTHLHSRGTGTHELSAMLHPAELGSVHIKATLHGDHLSLTLACADDAARAAVTAALPALHHQLGALTSVDVQLGDRGPGTDHPSQRERADAGPQGRGEPEPDPGRRSGRNRVVADTALDRWM